MKDPKWLDTVKKHEANGVIFIDGNHAYIEESVKIGRGTTVEPNVFIKGNTVIGENCVVGMSSEITDCVIGDGAVIRQSVLLESEIGGETAVGPFAYVRPNCKIGRRVKIGDFVEIKNSTLGDGSKFSHLTYVGDADVGKDCNFGCGTVVVNYDGAKKHRATVDDNAFIGCNTNLVSPVHIGENAFTAAGSTITGDVPPNSLAIARSRQTVRENWRRPVKEAKEAKK
jgi:bifunctional UDP-N-acetylglucosamine pyrophosphorylase/glucosamine-1-phosphate N-acetyltransferase